MPCSIKLLRAPKSVAAFHDFSDFEKLVEAAKADSTTAHLIVLLGGEAGLRCGEIMALEWRDIDLAYRQVSIARSQWKARITAPKGGNVTCLDSAAARSCSKQRGIFEGRACSELFESHNVACDKGFLLSSRPAL